MDGIGLLQTTHHFGHWGGFALVLLEYLFMVFLWQDVDQH